MAYLSQTVSNWCWATCATMLSRFLVTGSSIRICEAASRLIPQDACCVGAPPEGTFNTTWQKGNCNRTCTVEEVVTLHGMLGLHSRHVDGMISFEDLVNEIAVEGRPVEVAYLWSGFGAGGHVALVQGIDPATRTVNIHDPWPDNNVIVGPFNDLVTAYGKGTWFHTWIDISTTGA